MNNAERWNDLTEEQRVAIINLGFQLNDKMVVIVGLGHTTLKGHCCYLKEDNGQAINVLLMALNGNNASRNLLLDLVSDAMDKRIF